MSGTVPFFQVASTGYSVASIVDLDESPVVAVKASSGTIRGWHIYNPNSSVSYVQFFNVAASGVTLGTTTPTFVIGVPANGAATLPVGAGIPFSTAISCAASTTATGNTGPTNDVVATIIYE